MRSGRYEFLRVEYLNDDTPDWHFSLWPRPSQHQWEIVVQPVPRIFRCRIRQYILDSALQQVEHWLVERAQLGQRGNDILAFFFDETSGSSYLGVQHTWSRCEAEAVDVRRDYRKLSAVPLGLPNDQTLTRSIHNGIGPFL